MKAMVLAAGFGTRLRPLTNTLPKPMFPLLGRPVLEHLLHQLAAQGVRDITLNLHHLPDAIRGCFGDGTRLGVRLNYSHESAILGTAGGILAARRSLENGPFFVINSDIVTDLDLNRVLAYHRERRAAVTLVLYDGEATGVHDPIEIDASNRVVHMIGASSQGMPEITSRVTFTGVQVLEPEIFDRIPSGRFCGTTSDVYPQMIEDGLNVYGYHHNGYWQDMGTLVQYLQVHQDALDGVLSLPAAAASQPPGSTRIKPPVWIGDDCRIAPDAQIGPYVSLEAGCVVEAGAVVEHSVLWKGARVGTGAQVRRSVVAEGARVPANTAVENTGFNSTR